MLGARSEQAFGADGTRTRDLRAASASLSQLSYGPRTTQCSRELKRNCPVHTRSLVVPGWAESKKDLRPAFEKLDRKEVAGVEICAIRGERIDLSARVNPLEEARASTTRRVAAHDYYVVLPRGPFAFANRSIYVDSELDRGQRDRGLCDVSFLIRCHWRQRYLRRQTD